MPLAVGMVMSQLLLGTFVYGYSLYFVVVLRVDEFLLLEEQLRVEAEDKGGIDALAALRANLGCCVVQCVDVVYKEVELPF